MWRPEGWKQIKEHRWGNVGLASGIFKDKEIEFEAGADAMVKALLDDGVSDIIKFNGTEVEIRFKGVLKTKGTWGFIPEE